VFENSLVVLKCVRLKEIIRTAAAIQYLRRLLRQSEDLESDGSGPRDVELGPEHAQAHMVQQVLLPPTRHG
jgi:hypothetical protein